MFRYTPVTLLAQCPHRCFYSPYNNLLKMCVMCIIRASSRVTAESSKNHISPITSQKYRELTYKTVVKELLSKGEKKPSGCQYLRFKPSALIMNRMLLLKEKDLVTSLRRWRCAAYLQIFIKQLLLLHYSRKLHKTTLGHT